MGELSEVYSSVGVIADPYIAVQEERRYLYIRDADPLFFGWQRDDNTKEEWLAAVQKIKDDNPYPIIEEAK